MYSFSRLYDCIWSIEWTCCKQSFVCSCFFMLFVLRRKVEKLLGALLLRTTVLADGDVQEVSIPSAHMGTQPVHLCARQPISTVSANISLTAVHYPKTKPVQGLVNSEQSDSTLQEDAVEGHWGVFMVFTSHQTETAELSTQNQTPKDLASFSLQVNTYILFLNSYACTGIKGDFILP